MEFNRFKLLVERGECGALTRSELEEIKNSNYCTNISFYDYKDSFTLYRLETTDFYTFIRVFIEGGV